jgi:hypothetical protein
VAAAAAAASMATITTFAARSPIERETPTRSARLPVRPTSGLKKGRNPRRGQPTAPACAAHSRSPSRRSPTPSSRPTIPSRTRSARSRDTSSASSSCSPSSTTSSRRSVERAAVPRSRAVQARPSQLLLGDISTTARPASPSRRARPFTTSSYCTGSPFHRGALVAGVMPSSAC